MPLGQSQDILQADPGGRVTKAPPEAPKYISLAETIWPSTQCGQTTDSFKPFNFAGARASVSIEVLTSREVFGQ
jgi:hypothetical protein